MEDHRTTPPRPPDEGAFREAVRHEDPSRWGPRTTESTYTPPPATYTGDDHTPAMRSTPPVAGTTASTGPAYASSDRVVERERVPGAIEAEPPVERRRFSIGATFLGWAVAAFFTLVFALVVAALTGGASLGVDAAGDVQGLATVAIIGYVVATFLAYLIGGYAAGRIALWDGVKHGLLTVAWAVLFAILAVVGGAALAEQVDLGSMYATYFAGIDLASLTGPMIVAIVVTLLAQLAGAALGGRIGERYHDRVHGIDTRERRRTLGGRRAY